MELITRHRRRVRPALTFAVSFVLAFASVLTAFANVPLTQIGSDTYTNTTSQHATQVEPDTFAFGSTIVMATQTGRFFDGGSSNVAWATSTNNGATWTTGNLPGITKHDNPANPYDRVSDAAVAFDARHNVWLISTLPILESGGVHGAAVVTSRSTNGGLTWGNPVTTATGANLDKNWIACDNTATSPFYGNCYTEFDDANNGDRLKMTTSSNGGLTWGPVRNTANNATGLGGQPVAQPNGTVIVPFSNANVTAIRAFRSTNGGASWSSPVTIASITDHTVAGSLRSEPLPSAEIDAAGRVYVVWQDCRFRSGCPANDIVMSTSTNGTTWTAVSRIPIDATNSGIDHFIPGLAVDRTTSGGGAHLGLTYYFYPVSNCSAATCQLSVGFISSTNGGTNWGAATQLAGPMTLSWLPNTSQGRMVGDYISTSYGSDGLAHGAFAVASVPTGGANCASATPGCHQPTFTPTSGLSFTAVRRAPVAAGAEQPVPNAAADHTPASAALTAR